MPARSPEVAFWETGSLDEHVSLIRRQVRKSVQDPELRALALKIVAGKADEHIEDPRTRKRVPVAIAWGEAFRLPHVDPCGHKDAVCESQALWNFAVENVRYVLDPDGYDLFATAKYTLLAGGGDCDDFVILLAALHKLVGFSSTLARIVSTNGKWWEHVYLLVGFPKQGGVTQHLALDPTVRGATPGWEYKHITHHADYEL